MYLKKLKRFFSLRATVCAILLEVITVPITTLTMGHAGPEGEYALLGWIGLLVNFPGFFIAGILASYDSKFSFAVCVFIIQMVLILSAIFCYKYLTSEKGNVLK